MLAISALFLKDSSSPERTLLAFAWSSLATSAGVIWSISLTRTWANCLPPSIWTRNDRLTSS